MTQDPQVWAEVDLAAYRHNVQVLQALTGPPTRLMAVVKADAYGHGAVHISRAAIDSGADFLGVSRLEEALELRATGIEAPVLILGYTPPEAVPRLIEQDLCQTVLSLPMAEALAGRAAAMGRALRTHIKVDTGMGRLGVLATEIPAERHVREVQAIIELPGLEVEGLFTHLATADSHDKDYSLLQLRRFKELVRTLQGLGIQIPLEHAANSAALMAIPDSHLDLVRPGIATYGLRPSNEWQKNDLDLRPVLQWKTRIIQLKEVPAGFGVSYGITYKTPEPTTLATVAVGYADGLNRLLSSRGEMLVRGHRARIVGRICMDLTILDVGDVPDVSVGDEVVILGRQGNEQITAEEMAATLDTLNYEIVTSISSRVPRIHLH